jgi:hypothetical protein
MINSIITNDKLNENKNSLIITYPRTVNIIFGNYPFPEIIHKFILDIKNNLDDKMKNYTNVKGGMTNWYHFIKNENFVNFVTYLINKYQVNYPNIFKHFLQRMTIKEAWGNEIKKGDSLDFHIHNSIHVILYLTKGCDLILPELNLKLTPKAGDYYIFPPQILHGFDKYEGDNNRYSLIFNIEQNNVFDYNQKLNKKK